MRLKKIEPQYFLEEKKENSISGEALIELIKESFKKKALFRFKAKGLSMAPFIKDEDVIVLNPFFEKKIKIGLPVAFIHPERKKLLIHRIVAQKGKQYLIRGDNLPSFDGWIPFQNILGYVCEIERNGKKIFLGLGAERFLISFLSRFNLLRFLIKLWRKLPESFRKKFRP